MADTRWKDLFDFLVGEGYKVYQPTSKETECKQQYIVLKGGEETKNYGVSSKFVLYRLLLYVPFGKYGDVEKFVASVDESMKKVYPQFIPLHDASEPFPDDNVKGFMVSVTYQNPRKLT